MTPAIGRIAALLLLLSPLCIALYSEPPLASALHGNEARAPALADFYSANHSLGGSVSFRSATLPLSASFAPLVVGAPVDGRIPASNGSRLLFAWGMDALPALPTATGHSGYCTRAECCIGEDCAVGEACSNYCDFDGDYCVEYQNRSYYTKEANITFCFRGVCGRADTAGNLVAIPQPVVEAMLGSSGLENLSVEANATITAHYQINDKSYSSYGGGAGDCYSNFTTLSYAFHFNRSMNFTVEGNRTLFFLRAPILREQWFRDNRFDTVLLSTGRLHSAAVYLNGNRSRNFTFYAYNVSTDGFGVQRITTLALGCNGTDGTNPAGNGTNCTGPACGACAPEGASWGIAGAAPVFLSPDNQTFGYAYAFNYTYEGMGTNALALGGATMFNATFMFNETLLSRQLSGPGGITETGAKHSPETARPSAPLVQDTLVAVTVSMGMLGVLLLAMLLNRSYK